MAKPKKATTPPQRARTATGRRGTTPSTTKIGLSAKDREVLLALGGGSTPRPELSVAMILHEARELEATVAKLGPEIVKRSDLDKNVGKDLAARIARLTAAEQAWLAARKITTPKDIRGLRDEGEALRGDAFAALRYFARGHGDAQVSLDAIAEGRGDADLIDDLSKLAALVERHASLLVKADLPKKPADALRLAAKRLADAAADRAVDPSAGELIELRNRAYWHLRALMDDIRAAGRYVYRADRRLLDLFRASGTRAKSRPTPKKAAEPVTDGA